VPARRKGERPLWEPKRKRPAAKIDRRTQQQMAAAVQQMIATQQQGLNVPPRVAARLVPRQQSTAPLPGAVRASQVFRFRKQLQPVWWALYTACGAAWWAERAQFTPTARGLVPVASAIVVAAVVVAFTRASRKRVRAYHQAMAAWCGLWLVIASQAGPGWWMVVWVAGWLPWSAAWVHWHRWRPAVQALTVEAQVLRGGPSDAEIFAELAEAKRWVAWLDNPLDVPNGVRYQICCRGTRTHIDTILGEQSALAAAFDASVDQVYAEADPSGVKSRGHLTKLRIRTLEAPRQWDGLGIDAATGLTVVGRFPDGAALHERICVPGVGGGARHTIVAGADGTGKTGMLDLGLCKAALSGFVSPVILDPQEGQALPAWRERVPYARGTAECLVYLRGLHEGMMARSRQMAEMVWTDPRSGRQRTGMGFYDYTLSGLPLVWLVIDEAPILLAIEEAQQLVLEIAKLGRKTGFRLVLAAQVPSIAELGKGELRSILNGGNVVCFRTGDKVSAGMVNIQADPHELPKYWHDLVPTVGLGYSDGPDARSATTCRTDWVPDPYEVAETNDIRGLDDLVAGKLAHAITLAAAEAGELNAAALEASSIQLAILRRLPVGQARTRGAVLAELVAQDHLSPTAIARALAELVAHGQVHETTEGALIRHA